MQTQAVTRAATASDLPPVGSRPARPILALLTVLALLAAGTALARAPITTIDPDLARVIRCMALIKGGFALAAFAGCFWRLARPAGLWRTPVYVAGPPLMAAGALGLWSLHGLGAAALGLHIGLFAVLAAALTDPEFFTGFRRRGRI